MFTCMPESLHVLYPSYWKHGIYHLPAFLSCVCTSLKDAMAAVAMGLQRGSMISRHLSPATSLTARVSLLAFWLFELCVYMQTFR